MHNGAQVSIFTMATFVPSFTWNQLRFIHLGMAFSAIYKNGKCVGLTGFTGIVCGWTPYSPGSQQSSVTAGRGRTPGMFSNPAGARSSELKGTSSLLKPLDNRCSPEDLHSQIDVARLLINGPHSAQRSYWFLVILAMDMERLRSNGHLTQGNQNCKASLDTDHTLFQCSADHQSINI